MLVLYRIMTHVFYFARQITITGIREGFNFDDCILPHFNKTNIFVWQQSFYFHFFFIRYDYHNRLRRRNHTTDGMCRKLLHSTIYW